MKHCILAKYSEEVAAEKREALLPEIEKVFAPLTELEGIHGVEVIPNVVERPNRYDLLIRIEMDADALSAYDASMPHKVWKNEYMGYMAQKAIFDYE